MEIFIYQKYLIIIFHTSSLVKFTISRVEPFWFIRVSKLNIIKFRNLRFYPKVSMDIIRRNGSEPE